MKWHEPLLPPPCSTLEVDVIVFCTTHANSTKAYEYLTPALREGLQQRKDGVHLYRCVYGAGPDAQVGRVRWQRRRMRSATAQLAMQSGAAAYD